MRITRQIILLISFKKPIIASAQLVERQERGFWPDFGDVWNSLEPFRGVGDLFQNPQDSDSWNTKPPPATDTTPDKQTSPDSPEAIPASPPSSDTSSPTEPVYKLRIDNSPSPLPGLEPDIPAVLPSVATEDCDSMNVDYADCSKTADQLVFTSSCAGIDPNQVVSVEARAQNKAIHETLVVMNNQNILAGRGGRGLRISTSHICDVYFYAVPLTMKQIQDVGKKPGVKSVRPNQDLLIEDMPQSSGVEDNVPAAIPILTAPSSQFEERGQIVEDRLAWDDLRFLSTPLDSQLSEAYLYDSNAGQGVTVFAVDSGVNILHDEFVTVAGENSLLEDQIFAMDTSGLPEDYSNIGTCRTSKIVGRTYGVAKKAKVVVTVVSPRLSSLVDVLVQITNYLFDRDKRKELARGYQVMSIMIQWDNDDPEITDQFEELLDILIEFYKLVVVVPSGKDLSYSNSDINKWPATAESRHDIIVVGGVDVRTGRTYPWSRGGPFLSVNAPGRVRCAQNAAGTSNMDRQETEAATAMVAGLAAYFLSLDDVGSILRRVPAAIPLRVKLYIMTVAYKRVDDDFPAVWNLLGLSAP